MSKNSEVFIQKYRIEREPPEGGFGYFVAIGMILPCAFSLGATASIGIMFTADFLKSIGTDTSALTIMLGINFISCSCACLSANFLFRKFSMRSIGLFGAVLWFLGSLTNAFATSVPMLTFSYGFVQGFGIGLILPVVYGTFNTYFIKKRLFVMGVAQTMKSVVVMLHPIVVHSLTSEFGHRGGMLLIAAIDAHAIFGMLLMHPVEWHQKVIKVPVDPQQSTVPLMIDEAEKPSRKPEVDLEQDEEVQPKCSYFFCRLAEYLDLKLLKDPIFVNIVVGITFTSFSFTMFTTMMPVHLVERGYSLTDAAMFASILASADLASRIVFSFVSYFFPIKSRYVCFSGATGAIFSILVYVNTSELSGLRVIIFVIGFMRGLVILPIQLVIADLLPKERFPSGYALFIFIQGTTTFLISPVIGWIRYTTQNYVICFYTLPLIICLCVIPWAVEFIWMWFKSKIRKNAQLN